MARKPMLKMRRTKLNWSRDTVRPNSKTGNVPCFTNYVTTRARGICPADQEANRTISKHKLRGMNFRYKRILKQHAEENARRLKAELIASQKA